MRTCEFIEFAKMNVTSTDLFKLVNIKEYLPLLVKKSIADKLSENQITFINGLAFTDNIINEILLDIAIIEAYTDLTFSDDDSINEYEEMAALGLIEMLQLKIGGDCEIVKRYFYTRVEEITKLYNSFEGLINRNVGVVTDKVIDVLNDIQKNVDKETLTEVLKTMQGFDLSKIIDYAKSALLKGGK